MQTRKLRCNAMQRCHLVISVIEARADNFCYQSKATFSQFSNFPNPSFDNQLRLLSLEDIGTQYPLFAIAVFIHQYISDCTAQMMAMDDVRAIAMHKADGVIVGQQIVNCRSQSALNIRLPYSVC